VIAPRLAKDDVPNADRYIGEGDLVQVGKLTANVWETPGHCTDHVSDHFAANNAVFVGDTMFVMGCGRIIGSTAEALHHSLQRLGALPAETKVYCGHEYTLSNAKFCAYIEPDNVAIAQRLRAIETMRAAGQMTVPTTIGAERETNVFLRARDVAELAARREAKNRF